MLTNDQQEQSETNKHEMHSATDGAVEVTICMDSHCKYCENGGKY